MFRREDRLNLKAEHLERFFAALQAAGMPEVPEEFSVVPRHQVIPDATLASIANFVRVFEQVTTREAWQVVARRDAPAIAQLRRQEVCFFSAWDFHLPPEGGCQLIEFNDNGSGLLFAAIINDLYLRGIEPGAGEIDSVACSIFCVQSPHWSLGRTRGTVVSGRMHRWFVSHTR